jgi:hypothetical protein
MNQAKLTGLKLDLSRSGRVHWSVLIGMPRRTLLMTAHSTGVRRWNRASSTPKPAWMYRQESSRGFIDLVKEAFRKVVRP